jgi:DNA polymerase I-like protein with 3'-5' exonuclease and polymerase domains
LWREQWREAGRYLDLISRLVGRKGSRVQIEHLFSKRLRGGVGYCDAANSFFQGLAADAAKAGKVELMYAMYEKGYDDLVYGCRELIFIHDEVVLEIPLERLHEAAYAARDRFVGGAQTFVPDVPLTASPAAMLRLSKAAGDPVHDAKGRLICYEDRNQEKAA